MFSSTPETLNSIDYQMFNGYLKYSDILTMGTGLLLMTLVLI